MHSLHVSQCIRLSDIWSIKAYGCRHERIDQHAASPLEKYALFLPPKAHRHTTTDTCSRIPPPNDSPNSAQKRRSLRNHSSSSLLSGRSAHRINIWFLSRAILAFICSAMLWLPS
mmetsp:Transcript_24087/g.59540  ORF Transcript_24087/g.59540 Transcript_24087/m.59540 type:complete len:115 (-) Transcript_24087:189-533(-)